MKVFVGLLLFSIYLVLAFGAIRRVDFTLEYVGDFDFRTNNATLKATSEDIATVIDPRGDINYKVTHKVGPVSNMLVNVTDLKNNTFTAQTRISFGGSHVHQEHVIYGKTIGFGSVVPSDHENIAIVASYNITQSEGAFVGALGGLSVTGYISVTSKDHLHPTVVLVSGVFWHTVKE